MTFCSWSGCMALCSWSGCLYGILQLKWLFVWHFETLQWWCFVHCSSYTLTYLLQGVESFLRSQQVLSQSRNSPHFMEPKGSLPHSQVPPPVPILRQLDSVHTPTSHFLNIHLNITFPSTPGSSKWSVSLRFPHQSHLHASALPIHATWPAHLILFHLINRIVFGEQYRSLCSSLGNFLHSPVTSSLLGPNIYLYEYVE